MKKDIKAVLFDVDGVVITAREKFFSEQFSEEYKVPLEDVREFFVKDLKPCSLGKADLKENLAPYLPRWKWKGTVDDFLRYWFTNDNELDDQVLDTIDKLQEQDIACYMATCQEKYRMTYLEEGLGLQYVFDGTFCTCNIGFEKSQLEYWEYIFAELGLEPGQIMFFDDKQKNVDFARSLGVDAHFYDGREVLEKQAAVLLS